MGTTDHKIASSFQPRPKKPILLPKSTLIGEFETKGCEKMVKTEREGGREGERDREGRKRVRER